MGALNIEQLEWILPKCAPGEGRRMWDRSSVSDLNVFVLEVSRNELCARLRREDEMLYTLAVILLIAWLLGVVGTYTIGAFVHALLVIAIVLFIIGFLNGRRTPVA
jgi:hypothetical protein